jgi:hypothetical protein
LSHAGAASERAGELGDSMTTAFITHPDCTKHEMGAHHPERQSASRRSRTN